MPSRKQRRRRAKDRRHEYEYVYVDDEGHEVQAPAGETCGHARERDGKERSNGAKVVRAKSGAPIREAKPPDWRRSVKRAALFAPLFFIVFSLVNKHMAIETRVLSSLAYSALFVPLTYMMDRMAYRTYLRRSGRRPAKN